MFDYVCHGALTAPDALKARVAELPTVHDIELIAPLFWADHCLECSPPACYASCAMFEANEIGRCRRVDDLTLGTIPGYDFPAAHLRFRKWAKLLCPCTSSAALDAESFLADNLRHEKRLNLTRRLDSAFLSAPKPYRYPVSRLVHHRYIKQFWPIPKQRSAARELCLVFWAVNPAQDSRLILDSYDFDEMLLTRNVYSVREGLNVWRVPTEKLSRAGETIYMLELFPSDDELLEVYMLFSDLVTFKADSAFAAPVNARKKPAKKVKCVAWDLDNTLWDGVIGEDGLDGVTPRPEMAELIRRLDERGILNTICSKNDEAPALAGLEKFGLRDYFLYPKINWLPKSGNLLEISRLLNINIDTFAFVDDSAFERAEVANALGCVRVFADSEAAGLLSRPEFDVPVTADSKKRRGFYMAEAKRQDAFSESQSGDYRAFIRSCAFQIDLAPCKTGEDIKRCHELLMRTNQLNASTNRIPFEEFQAIAAAPEKLVLRVSCRDRYGEYGTVGCLILEKGTDTLLCTDFVISCRVAKKKVESAVILRLMERFGTPMEIIYRPSERNHVLKDEFLSIGAEYDEANERMRFTKETIRDADWAAVTDHLGG